MASVCSEMSARPYNYSTGSVYSTALLLVRSAARIADGRAVLEIGRRTMGWVSSVSRACASGIDRLGRGEEKGEAVGAKAKRTQKQLLYGAEKVGLRWMDGWSLAHSAKIPKTLWERRSEG